MDKKLVKYIRENAAKGFSHDEIIERLTREGWDEEDVLSAFEHASEEHKSHMRTWFAVGGFAAFIILFLIVYFAVLSPTAEKPVVEKPEVGALSASQGVQAGIEQGTSELQSGTAELQPPEPALPSEAAPAVPAQQQAASAPAPAQAIDAKQLEYVLVELELYKLHPNPLNGALPELEVYVKDTNQVFGAVVENNLVHVTEGSAKSPDARVEVDSYAIGQIISASDETQTKERAAQLFSEREQRGYRGILIAGHTDLLLKGYLALYSEAKTLASEAGITGNAIEELDATASQFIGMFFIISVLWGALILRMSLLRGK